MATLTQFTPNEQILEFIRMGDQAGGTIIRGDTPEEFSESFRQAMKKAKTVRDERKKLAKERENAR